MKRSISLLIGTAAAICLPWTAFSQPKPFNGFYGAIDVGITSTIEKIYHQADYYTGSITYGNPLNTLSIHTVDSTGLPNRITDMNATGVLSLGYTFTPGCWVWGLEARAKLNNLKMTDRLDSTALQDETHVNLHTEFAILGKIGFLPESCTLLYGLIGPQWGRFTTHNAVNYYATIPAIGLTLTGNDYLRDSQYRFGWLFGLGIERWIGCHWTVGLEYNYTRYNRLRYPFNSTTPAVIYGATSYSGGYLIETNSIKVQTNTTLLKLAYYFC